MINAKGGLKMGNHKFAVIMVNICLGKNQGEIFDEKKE